jgi:hypothetical protein
LRYQLAPARVPRFRRLGEKLDQISRLFRGLWPSFCRSGCSVVLEFYLTASQACLIGLNFAKAAPNLGRLLRSDAAVFVKFDWLVRHNRPALPGFASSRF